MVVHSVGHGESNAHTGSLLTPHTVDLWDMSMQCCVALTPTSRPHSCCHCTPHDSLEFPYYCGHTLAPMGIPTDHPYPTVLPLQSCHHCFRDLSHTTNQTGEALLAPLYFPTPTNITIIVGEPKLLGHISPIFSCPYMYIHDTPRTRASPRYPPLG